MKALPTPPAPKHYQHPATKKLNGKERAPMIATLTVDIFAMFFSSCLRNLKVFDVRDEQSCNGT